MLKHMLKHMFKHIQTIYIYIFSATTGPVEAEKPDVLLVKQGELLALFKAGPPQKSRNGAYTSNIL